jgi:hypothetical protein
MKKESAVDLNTLKELELGPNWENDVKITERSKNDRVVQRKRKGNSTKTNKHQNQFSINPFPDYKIITKLLKKVKQAGITYELKEIYNVFINDKKKLNYRVSWQENEKLFYITNLNGVIFDNKKKLVSYIIQNQLEDLFEKKKIEDENQLPNFQSMLKCPKTNKLLPPKSYHEFHRYVLEHMHENSIITDFDKYCLSLDTTTDITEIKNFKDEEIKKFAYIKKNGRGKIYSLIDINNDILENKEGVYFKEQSSLKLDYEQVRTLNFNIEINLRTLEIKNLLYGNIINAIKRAGFHLIKFDKKTYATWVKNKKYDLNMLSELSKNIINHVKKNKVAKKKSIIELNNVIKNSKKNILLEMRFLINEGYLRELSDSSIIIA